MSHSSVVPKSLELCKLMHPQDANIAGNVHGGTILKMIEDAGMIATTRYCNQAKKDDNDKTGFLCVLARVERTDFCQPMFVGEVSSLHADITFCSEHSIEIKVAVWAENVFKATKRLTNRATLWYCPVAEGGGIGTVPKLSYSSPAAEIAGRERYEKQKKDRCERTHPASGEWKDFGTPVDELNKERGTVDFAQSSLIHLVNINDCGFHGNVTGGVTMKMMDEVAGICAARHCHTNVVTASMDAMDFHQPISKGSLMHLKSRPTFVSNKSIEIQVVVDVEKVFNKGTGTNASMETEWYRACSAFFTFVSLGPPPERKVQLIQPLILKSDAERERFEQGRIRYNNRKKSRTLSQ